jgi:hypothetical protein
MRSHIILISGMIALPSGILVAGFLERMQGRKAADACPHCGEKDSLRRQ